MLSWKALVSPQKKPALSWKPSESAAAQTEPDNFRDLILGAPVTKVISSLAQIPQITIGATVFPQFRTSPSPFQKHPPVNLQQIVQVKPKQSFDFLLR